MQKISYISDGEKYTLTESEDLVVVRTKKNLSLYEAMTTTASKKELKKFCLLQTIDRADVYIIEVKPHFRDPLTIRDEARDIFKLEKKTINFAGRVFINAKTNEWVLYTENIFIKFTAAVPAADCRKLIHENGLKIKQKIKFSHNAWFVEMPKGSGIKVIKVCKDLFRKREVEYCEPELIWKTGKKKLRTPKIYHRQWHLKTTVIGRRRIRASAHVAKAHEFTQGKGATIAIIDDGIDIRHKEFNIPGKIKAPKDISYNTNDPLPKNRDDNHGTCCAGVACAAGINKVCGVAPLAKLIPIRCVSQLGSKDEAFAIIHAVDHGADVISCSWGPEDGDWWSTRDKRHGRRHPISALTSDAIKYAVTKGRKGKGCVVVFAAGNGNEIADPDRYISHPDVIAVAACNDREIKSVYSDYGRCIWVCFPSNDFEAKVFRHPAPLTCGIWTTDRLGIQGHRQKHLADCCNSFGGTSSACPGVAGVCALIISANPLLTNGDVKTILRLSADKIDPRRGRYDDNGHSIFYGYGRVNAAKAVELAINWK